MKCPACDSALATVQVGTLKVDVCQNGCGGIWFDAFELQRIDDANEVAGEPLLRLGRAPGIHVDPTRKRECPRCAGIKLKRHLMSPKSSVEVDECPNCGGYWLDDGELARVRAERTDAAKAIRPDLSGDLIRYLYQVRTAGQDQRASQ